jgi:hypothetical protein
MSDGCEYSRFSIALTRLAPVRRAPVGKWQMQNRAMAALKTKSAAASVAF